MSIRFTSDYGSELHTTTKGYGHGRDAGVFAAAPPPKFVAGAKPPECTSASQ